jgi:hypothetical protein
MKEFLTKEQFLNESIIETEEVEVGSGKMLVRGLTASEREAFVREMGGEEGVVDNLVVRLVSNCVIDPNSKIKLFSEKDVKALGDKSSLIIDKLFKVAQKLSGLTEEAVADIEKK